MRDRPDGVELLMLEDLMAKYKPVADEVLPLFYGGAVGYLAHDGTLDTAIVIRADFDAQYAAKTTPETALAGDAYETVTTGNLLLSVMDMYGIHRDVQGDSTGRLEDL